jgi:hypothetical protein
MTEIKAGPKLDRAVAEAIGYSLCMAFKAETDPVSRTDPSLLRVPELILRTITADSDRMPDNLLPKFSTDLNAAFAAAERVELFSDYYYRMLGVDESDKTWGVYQQDEHHIDRPIGNRLYDTPALAICAAILKLKEEA